MEKVGARFIKKCFKIHSTIFVFVFVFQSTELVSQATCQTMLEITTTDLVASLSSSKTMMKFITIKNNSLLQHNKETFKEK
jgi:hypothetical protein